MDFNGQRVVITGAASGIGRELSRQLAGAGATVVMLDVNGPALTAAAEDIAAHYRGRTYSRVVDVRDYDGFQAAVEAAATELGGIDIFINNAGIGVAGDFVTNTREEIDHITGVNYLGMIYGAHIILPHFRKQGFGRLVNMASAAGLHGYPRMSLYCGAKAGIIVFSEALRFEMAREGLDLSVALPTTTDTPMIMNRLGEADEQVPGILMAIPLCRTEDVARAILKGIKKNQFFIFPTLVDRMSLYTVSYTHN
jgi:short-subunit dehydrogenase